MFSSQFKNLCVAWRMMFADAFHWHFYPHRSGFLLQHQAALESDEHRRGKSQWWRLLPRILRGLRGAYWWPPTRCGRAHAARSTCAQPSEHTVVQGNYLTVISSICQVVLYNSNLTNLHNLTGDQIGAYFGYTIATCDINGDGLDDILIGAPMWTDFTLMGKFETGRVYVVYQDKNVSLVQTCWHFKSLKYGKKSIGQQSFVTECISGFKREAGEPGAPAGVALHYAHI